MHIAGRALLALSVSLAAAAEADAERRPWPGAAGLREALEAILATPAARAQPEPAGEVAIDYSPTSRAAAVLGEAQRAEQERNWRRAAELYQRVLDEAPGELCRHSSRLYVPMQSFVEERLAGLPPEGLAAYRNLVEAQAAELYAANSQSSLEQVASRFLLSSCGDNALDRLATAWLARGEPGRALRAWRRLLRLCRDSDVAPGPLAAKLAVCLLELGRRDTAQAFIAQAAKLLGDEAKVEVAGRTLRISDFRSEISDSRHNQQSAIRSPQSPIRPGPLAWADALAARETSRTTFVPRGQLVLDGERVTTGEPAVRVAPVVAGGAAVYPTRRGVAARSVATGKLAWERPWSDGPAWRTSGPLFSEAGFSVGRWSCSANADSVFCSLPFLVAARPDRAEVRGELLTMGVRTGQPLWRRGTEDVYPGERGGGWFASAPLPCDERLVVGLRGGGGGDEFHLCCLRARDGALAWRTFIAGRPSDPLYRWGRPQAWFEGMPAEGRGLVVANAGGGIVAGVELATGAIRWLARYDQVAARRGGWRWYPHDGWRSWTPLVADGVVYATPQDSDFLYAIELDSGRLLWRRPRGDGRYIAGVQDGKAFVVGSTALCLSVAGEVEWQVALPSAAVGQPALAGHVLHVPLADGIIYLHTATGGELAWTSWEDWGRAQPAAASTHIGSGDLAIAEGKLFVATPFALNVFAPLERREAVERQAAAEPDEPLSHYALAVERHWAGDAVGAAESLEKVLELGARRPGAASAAVLADARRRLSACYGELSRQHERAGRSDLALAACEAALRFVPQGHERQTLGLRRGALARSARRWDAAVAAYQDVLAAAAPGDAAWDSARDGLGALLREVGREPYAAHDRAAAAALERGSEAELLDVMRRYPNAAAAPDAMARLAELAERAGRPAEARLWLYQLARDHPQSPLAPEALHQLAIGYARAGAPAMARGALERLRRAHPEWPVPTQAGAAAELDAGVFLARHSPGQFPVAGAPPKPPFGVGWEIRPNYGAAGLRIVSDPAGSPAELLVMAGRSLECRAAADGLLRWADRPGWLGIQIVDADSSGGGVLIRGTVSDGNDAPAERAGLRGGDILVSFDGRRLRDTQDLITTCTERRAGSVVRLEFLRDEAMRTVEVKLGARPSLRTDDALLPPVGLVGIVGGHALVRKASRVDAVRLSDGEVAWSRALDESWRLPDGATEVLGAAAPGVAVLADALGRLMALDPATGRPLWTTQLGEPTVHEMTLGEHGLAVASSSPPTVLLLNPLDGQVVFEAAERRAAGAPAMALDRAGRLCYAMSGSVGCYDATLRRLLWGADVPNFAARQVRVGGAVAVFHGVDAQGVEVLECRHLATGEPAWSLALARGERLVLAEAGADALYIASRQGARFVARRIEHSTGRVAWTQSLLRQEELAAWDASGPALVLGLTVVDDTTGVRRADVAALDRATGEVQQRLTLGMGVLAALGRVGPALCAVIEGEAAVPRAPAWFGDEVVGEPPRFRIVRLTGNP